jgi:hypothetical protein
MRNDCWMWGTLLAQLGWMRIHLKSCSQRLLHGDEVSRPIPRS